MLSIIKLEDNYTCDYQLGSKILKKDIEYILNVNWANEMRLHPITMDIPNYNINIDLSNKRLLIIRAMGAGDMLFLSAIVQVIKNKYETCTIGIACIKEQHDILKMIPGVDEYIEYPININEFNSYNYFFQVAQVIEGNQNNNEKNIYEAYFENLLLNNVESDFCHPFIKTELFSNIKQIPNRVGIHPFANDPLRCLNQQIVSKLYNELIKSGYEPIIIGTKTEYNSAHQLQYCNWTYNQYPTYIDIAKFTASCQYIISTDSLITHLAQALNIETICFYGPFSSDSRVKYYKNIHIIDSNPECRCYMHQLGKCKIGFPEPICLRFDIQSVINIIKKEPEIISELAYVIPPEIDYYGIKHE